MLLTKKEKLFCCLYAELGNITEAATAAKLPTATAYADGAEILAKPAARKLIRRQRSFIREKELGDVSAALRRIIFGEANDAVRLVLTEDEGALPLDRMNFFGISELKKIKGGGVEMKLFSRLDALKLLYEIERDNALSEKSNGFFSSLRSTPCPEITQKEEDFPE